MSSACRIEKSFFDAADLLRAQFDQRVAPGTARKNRSTLKWIEAPQCYRYLGATADHLFDHVIVQQFLKRVRSWARTTLGVHHASSPQVQVYVRNCRRELAADAVRAKWHYIFSLSPEPLPKIRVLAGAAGKSRWFGIGFSRILSAQLQFNHLLVHGTDLPYGVEDSGERSEQPRSGAVLLHGYLW